MVNVLGQKHLRFTLVHLFFTQSAQFFSLGFVFSPKPGWEFEDSKSRKKRKSMDKERKGEDVLCFHNWWLNSLPALPSTKAEFAVETLMIGSPCTSLQTHTHAHTHACKTKQYQCPMACSDFTSPSPRQTFRNSHILLHWSEVRRGLHADRQIKTEEEKVISRIKLIMRESGWDDHMISGQWGRNETSVSDVKRSSSWFTTWVINMKSK